MRVAALFDIHGNLPALEAVLHDLREAGADQIVVGGDVVPGPMPRETLERLLDCDMPVRFIRGNCELAVLAQGRATEAASVTYWGTASGRPLPERDQEVMRWTARQLHSEYEPVLASWPRTLRLEVRGLGDVLCCHSTPRSEAEIFTRVTPADRLLPLFDGLEVSVVICGHTHMQFDRTVGRTRVVNAGSVGAPFGDPGAFWALLGPGVQLRYTPYDLEHAAARIRATEHPHAEEQAHTVLHPPTEADMLELFGTVELR